MLKEQAYRFGRWILKTHPPRWIVFIIDILICLISLFLAFYIRLNFQIDTILEYPLLLIVSIVLVIRAGLSIIFRIYYGLIRFSTFIDLERVIIVNTIGLSGLVIINLLYNKFVQPGVNLIPYGIVAMEFFITTFLMITLRLSIKTLYFEITSSGRKKTNVVIYGTDQLADLTKQVIENNSEMRTSIAGFISPDEDSKRIVGNFLSGVKIYAERELNTLSEKFGIEKLIIAEKKINNTTKERLLELCSNLHIRVLTVPITDNWIDESLSTSQIRDLKIEDLLERQSIRLDKKKVSDHIKGKVILVTGAAGSIGSELVLQIFSFRPKLVILFDQAETPLHSFKLELLEKHRFSDFEIVLGDVYNKYRLNSIFKKYKPQIVFHAAAYKHVPMLEDNPKEAIRTNVIGTKNLADVSNKYGVEDFIMISTDKAVRPTSVMGASKRIAEMYIQSLGAQPGVKTAFTTTRFGNVLGSNGSVVERFREQISNGEAITITHPDMKRYFMTIPEAVQLVMEAAAMGEGGEIFVFDMGKMVRIVDLAEKMIRLSGLVPEQDIEIKYTGIREGERLYEVLLADKEKLLPTYNPKIMRAKVENINYDELDKTISGLHDDLHNFEINYVVKLMKEIVPEFISENSVYSVFNK